MSDVVVSLSEKRLSRDGVKITFFKALVKLDAIENRYPGGLEGFIEKYKKITPRKDLIGVTFLNTREIAAFVSHMQSFGIVEGQDLATANQLQGETISCEGIQFVPVAREPQPGANQAIPVWYACSVSS